MPTMAQCSHPGCYRNDEIGDSDPIMHFEYVEWDDVYITVCDEHVDDDKVTIELNDKIKQTEIGVIDHIVSEVTNE